MSAGEWHLPFISEEETCSVALNSSDLQKLSVARCASTSYKTTDGFDMTFERAEAIYDKLHTKPFHASPFEHVAQADERRDTWRGRTWDFPIEHGNFVGFRQLRRQLELQA